VEVIEKSLFVSGTVLLSLSALTGFVQHRHRERPELFARWRVVHTGGTAGAVQLLALCAVWGRFGQGLTVTLLAAGLIVATFAFFLGPLARALDWPRTTAALLVLGSLVALPTYLALPLVLLL
jgi:uncharacterized membrane protein YdcZ (DUF606 family)